MGCEWFEKKKNLGGGKKEAACWKSGTLYHFGSDKRSWQEMILLYTAHRKMEECQWLLFSKHCIITEELEYDSAGLTCSNKDFS